MKGTFIFVIIPSLRDKSLHLSLPLKNSSELKPKPKARKNRSVVGEDSVVIENHELHSNLSVSPSSREPNLLQFHRNLSIATFGRSIWADFEIDSSPKWQLFSSPPLSPTRCQIQQRNPILTARPKKQTRPAVLLAELCSWWVHSAVAHAIDSCNSLLPILCCSSYLNPCGDRQGPNANQAHSHSLLWISSKQERRPRQQLKSTASLISALLLLEYMLQSRPKIGLQKL